jgi:ribonuclease D
MPQNLPDFQLIENNEELISFYEQHKAVEWIAFDTEFVGEKRYVTTLCLIQVASVHGIFLIDPFNIRDLSPFIKLIEDAAIVKITHAGDNDYRLLFQQFDALPSTIFDTQIAAGFVGYNYPTSFARLVEGELGIRLKKGYAVTDWESRPLKPRQLGYAINDVIYLEDLWNKLSAKLEKNERQAWAEEEFSLLEKADYYDKGPHSEALNSKLMHSLKRRERVFLIRLLEWRRSLAEKRNHSKEMVLSSKYIAQIVKGISSGRDALFQNRRLPSKVVEKYGKILQSLYHQEISEEEQALLKRIPADVDEDPRETIVIEMLYQVIKYKCMEDEMSINLALPRNILKKIRTNDSDAYHLLGDGWRKEWLGVYFVDWLASAQSLDLELLDDKIVLIPKKI